MNRVAPFLVGDASFALGKVDAGFVTETGPAHIALEPLRTVSASASWGAEALFEPPAEHVVVRVARHFERTRQIHRPHIDEGPVVELLLVKCVRGIAIDVLGR